MFRDMKNHLIAVGSPLVWASRAVDEAKAEELAVNNLLYNLIVDNIENIAFTTRTATAKSGENFRARIVSFVEVEDDETIDFDTEETDETFDESDPFRLVEKF